MIILICCLSQNRVIGHRGKLPWRFPADLEHFKAVTSGNIVVFGRKTYESVGTLPNRKLVVLTRQPSPNDTDIRGVLWTSDPNEAVALSKDSDVFIAGGEQVYSTYLTLADYMMLTFIHRDVKGDTFFPVFDPNEWDTVIARRGNQHSYIELKRVADAA